MDGNTVITHSHKGVCRDWYERVDAPLNKIGRFGVGHGNKNIITIARRRIDCRAVDYKPTPSSKARVDRIIAQYCSGDK